MNTANDAEPQPQRNIVLLPGLFAGEWIWEQTKTFLTTKGFHVEAPAEAVAELDSSLMNIDKLANYTQQFLNEHGIEESVLCGNSIGALIALVCATHSPERIKALVLSGIPGLGEEVN